MNTRTRPEDVHPWTKPPSPSDPKDAGYDEALAASIATGRAQLEAGHGIPHDEFWARWDLVFSSGHVLSWGSFDA